MKAKYIDPSEATGNDLKVHNLIDNFIQDVNALKGDDTVIGITVITERGALTAVTPTVYYVPVIVTAFMAHISDGYERACKSAKGIINKIFELPCEALPSAVGELYQNLKDIDKALKDKN